MLAQIIFFIFFSQLLKNKLFDLFFILNFELFYIFFYLLCFIYYSKVVK